jgi:DivIVA domain-containing protein
MPEDRRMSISTSPQLSPDEVARHNFGTVRRGFDPEEVRSYLDHLAQELRTQAEEERQLRSALDDAEHRAANPVLDEETLAAALGVETSRVLRSAHEAAHEMVAKATAEAERLVTEAQEEITATEDKVSSQLADRVAQTDATTAELRRRAEDESTTLVELARNEAEGIVAQARAECREMVEEAQGLRARVLGDLAKRRKILHAQIEQLRAGREHLAETVRGVRRSIDTIADDLFRAEDEARLAAEAAGRQVVSQPDVESPEELAATLLAGEALAETGLSAVDEPAVSGYQPEETPGVYADQAPANYLTEAPTEYQAEVSAPTVDPYEARFEPESPGGFDPGISLEPASIIEIEIDLATEADQIDPSDPSDPSDQEEVPKPTVDDLFAKLRASAEQSGAAPGEAEADTNTDTEADQPGGAPVEDRNPLEARRDELIAPIVKALGRRLKRTFQDDQNDILDRLRSNHFTWSVGILPEDPEHLDAYSTAALPYLEEAAEAGATFVGAEETKGASVDDLLGVAHELAETVVGPLRRRLSDDERLERAEESEVAEHVGSAFREWKGERVERLASDYVVAAFSAGSIAGATKDPQLLVEWVAVAAPEAVPCPDCEDNALNGPQRPGEEFPTGHGHPPVHPGCRCLLAPVAP